MSTAGGLSDGGKVSSLSVLDLGGVDWDSIVDHWDGIVAGVVGRGVVSWASVVGGSVSGKVGGLSVLDLGGIYGHSVVDLDGGSSMSPWGSVRLAGPQGSLMQMVEGTGFGVSVSVGDLSSGYFGGVMGHTVSGDSVGPWGGVGHWGGHMGVRDSWGTMVSVRDGRIVVCDDGGDDGVVGNWVNWGWSNGQVGTSNLETVHGIGGVFDRLNQAVSINVRVSTMRHTIGGTALVLLRVGVGVSVRVRAMVILAAVLAGHSHTVRRRRGRCHQQKSYHLQTKSNCLHYTNHS